MDYILMVQIGMFLMVSGGSVIDKAKLMNESSVLLSIKKKQRQKLQLFLTIKELQGIYMYHWGIVISSRILIFGNSDLAQNFVFFEF